jgi:hypothetical protein
MLGLNRVCVLDAAVGAFPPTTSTSAAKFVTLFDQQHNTVSDVLHPINSVQSRLLINSGGGILETQSVSNRSYLDHSSQSFRSFGDKKFNSTLSSKIRHSSSQPPQDGDASSIRLSSRFNNSVGDPIANGFGPSQLVIVIGDVNGEAIVSPTVQASLLDVCEIQSKIHQILE